MSILTASLVVAKPRAFKAVLRIVYAIASAIIVSIAGSLFGPIGAIVASIALTALGAYLFRPPRTTMEAGKVNTRIAEPTRWLVAGQVAQGGGVLFAEFDTEGNLWYLVVHSDSILTNPTTCSYLLDDVPATVDGDRYVVTKDFRLNGKKHDAVTVDGGGDPFVQIWTTTYSESDPVPARITELDTAFPSKWTSDHKLVGTTFSVVKMKTINVEDRYKLYHFRGAIGLGEPSIRVVGEWSNVYDPRDDGQTNGTPTTYAFSRNPVLIWAWFRTHRYGRNKARSEINWDKIGEQAAICDQTVTGISGSHTRYTCDIAIPEDIERVQGEQQIMLTMDAQLVFDDDGKCWPRVGAYTVPVLALNRNRDIVAMESQETQDGESELQGVIVRYTDPQANYTTQPSAPWYNPAYYVDGVSNQFLTVDILACADHNQAMRLAKAIGMRSQPVHRLFPTVGLRGLKARQERIVDLNYDNTFSGDYEIVTPVEIGNGGIFCGFGLVPVDADRWTLLTGEEKPKPVVIEGDSEAGTLDVPTGVDVHFANGRLEGTFDAPTRSDVMFQFQVALTSEIMLDLWTDMTVSMATLFTYSLPLASGAYSYRYRAVSSGGLASAWTGPIDLDVYVGAPSELAATSPSVGQAKLDVRLPLDATFANVQLYLSPTTNPADVFTFGAPITGSLGEYKSLTATVGCGIYYAFARAFNGTGDPSAWVGPIGPFTVALAPVTATSASGPPTRTLHWTAPDDANYDHVRLYWNAPGGTFGTSVFIATEGGPPNTADSYFWSAGGTYDVFIEACNAAETVRATPVRLSSV